MPQSISNETLNPQQVAPLERWTDKVVPGQTQTQATRHKWSASITSHVAHVDMRRKWLLSGKEDEEVGSNASLFPTIYFVYL